MVTRAVLPVFLFPTLLLPSHAQHQRRVHLAQSTVDPASRSVRLVMANNSGLFVTGVSVIIARRTPDGRPGARALTRGLFDEFARAIPDAGEAPVNRRIEWTIPLQPGDDPTRIRLGAAIFHTCETEGSAKLLEPMLVPRREKLAASKTSIRSLQAILQLSPAELARRLQSSTGPSNFGEFPDQPVAEAVAAQIVKVQRQESTPARFVEALRSLLASRQRAVTLIEPAVCR